MPNPVFNRLPRLFLNRFREKELAVYMPVGMPDRAISVVFNAAYQAVGADGIPFDDTAPTAWIMDADAPYIDNRDRLQIGDTIYQPVSCRPDGYGMSQVKLKRL